MTNAPDLRASDDDRDRVIAELREHHAVGRLTAEEFQERLDKALATRTLGELAELTADLPALQSAAAPAPARPTSRLTPAWRGAWASWASVSMVCFVIWLISVLGGGGMSGFWFLWVVGPWGAILLARWVFGTTPGGGSDHDKGRS